MSTNPAIAYRNAPKRFYRALFAFLLATLLCSLHAADSLAQEPRAEFDHDATVFPLEFKHALATCESCHVQGVFAGTPRQCRDCHSNTGRIKASAAPSGHIRFLGDCDSCHRPDSWFTVLRVDHAVVAGTCVNCHDGFTASGKNTRHVQSSNVCDDCHMTLTWTAAVFNHVGINGNCVSCHDGFTASGKHARHILSAASCEDCHTTFGWQPVARVDHGSVVGTCFSCHNGVVASGKHALHDPTSDDCQLCHSPLGWTPATNR